MAMNLFRGVEVKRSWKNHGHISILWSRNFNGGKIYEDVFFADFWAIPHNVGAVQVHENFSGAVSWGTKILWPKF